MACLLDTGILLRLVDEKDQLHNDVRQAVATLAGHNEELFTTTQNVAEFWNVATRPIANNGLELPAKEVHDLLTQVVESACTVVVERETAYQELKRLGLKYGFRGKQVHDARLVAQMLSWQIDKILTLNQRDFQRYEPDGITILVPPLPQTTKK